MNIFATLVPHSGKLYFVSTGASSSSVCHILKTGIILPLFKGKGAKSNDKDNCRGITLFPTRSKIYEMILVNRLGKFASEKDIFLKCSLDPKKKWDALKRRSLF